MLRSPALAGLPAGRVSRACWPTAWSHASSSTDACARWRERDRVLAALERAVDPNLDGNLDDRAEVILLGVARSFDGGGPDPVAPAADAADAAGSLVVAPAGNDGPTFGAVGTVGGPAASEHGADRRRHRRAGRTAYRGPGRWPSVLRPLGSRACR